MQQRYVALVAIILSSMFYVIASSIVPALFIFGDSLVDVGNNNYLNTIAKANYPPHGINFGGGRPTGRFCDGNLMCDYLASLLGLPFPPPYLADKNNVIQGANFGSAGCGIFSETGFGEHISLSQQVSYFIEAKNTLNNLIGEVETLELVSKSLYYISIPNNDINNYFQLSLGVFPLPSTLRNKLISIFSEQIQILYKQGARKFTTLGLSDVGCVPTNQRLGECNKVEQESSKAFNDQLISELSYLRSSLQEIQIVYLNLEDVMDEVVQNPTSNGFVNANHGCCKTSVCLTGFPYCSNPSSYAFWDVVHFTSSFNKMAIDKYWSGGTHYAHPINIQQLALL